MTEDAGAAVASLYRAEWGRIVATLIRLVGDFDLAEEAAQQAFEAAIQQWPASGVPEHPRAWIIQTARHRAIDRTRRQARLAAKLESYASSELPEATVDPIEHDPNTIADDQLRLIFTCCHPALAREAQVALTLRTLAGLETEEIARAFLVPAVTMAQRLVRAKRKIATAGIPYVVPGASDMPERLDAVLTVVYLIFTEGYAATRGAPLVRTDLCAEAIRLGRLLRHLTALTMPTPESEVSGLLALMLLHDARRNARVDASGDVVLLDEQDRSRWDHGEIEEALALVDEAGRGDRGPYALQAAIAAVHCGAARKEDTDWRRIVDLYGELERTQPSPVVSLNRAVAVAMAEGPQRGLAILDALGVEGDLDDYHLFHAARADLLRRTGSMEEAARSYERALVLVGNDSERRFLERRLDEVRGSRE